MASELNQCYDELLQIRKYLIKKGKSRFKGNTIKNNLEKAKTIFDACKSIIQECSIRKISSTELLSINETFNSIKNLYSEILTLCTKSEKENTDSDYSDASEIEATKMDFDLKTACGLIPLLDDSEDTTKRLIDTVDMYSNMLNEDGKKILINFVLKGRLSENAKLRMSTTYPTVNDLIKDLKNTLLPKKSFTAIQSQLQTTTQGWRSIDQYGAEIEKLFSELTIAQADGNVDNYGVLKPLNEKISIKRFSDGLKDQRLGTIIAARNYTSLKDAVQAAKDEEVSRSSTSTAEVMGMYHSQRPFNRYHRGRSYASRGNRPNYFARGQHQYSYRRYIPSQHSSTQGNNSSRGSRARGNFNQFRGRRNVYRSRSHHAHRNVNVMAPESSAQTSPNTESLNHFFRV
ncbi:uncharacterized protein [Choristoneura fumiferana]|uniref:uncharacterized protein n=1 Tax=Choristoneura fumiferana TaxID=7141 RepID=UPI003D154F31